MPLILTGKSTQRLLSIPLVLAVILGSGCGGGGGAGGGDFPDDGGGGGDHRAFYVVDVMPTVLEGTDASYMIKLAGNDTSTFSVKYGPDDLGLLARPLLPAYCCRLRVTPSVSLSPVSLASGESVTFTAVKLWTSEAPPTFNWTLTNADGRLSITPSANTTSALVRSLGGTSTGTVDVTEPVSGWSNGAVTINVP